MHFDNFFFVSCSTCWSDNNNNIHPKIIQLYQDQENRPTAGEEKVVANEEKEPK